MVALLSLAGCVAPDGFVLPAPRLGESYVYDGSDGSAIEVVIQDVQARADGASRRHAAVILSITYTPATHASRGDGPFRFEEAVDLGQGLIVQQVAHCGVPLAEGLDAPFQCFDDRATVYFAAGGGPGAFGAAPFWGEHVAAGDERGFQVMDPNVGDWTPVAEATADGCIRWAAPEGPQGEMLRALPWTVMHGAFTLCPDSPLPTRFEPPLRWISNFDGDGAEHGPLAYTLRERETSTGRSVPREPTDAWDHEGALLPRASLADPLYTRMPTSAPFSVEEANAEVAKRVPEYRRLLEEGGILHGFTDRNKGESSSRFDLYRERTDLSVLEVANGQEGLRVVVTKTQGNSTVGQDLWDPQYEVQEVKSTEGRTMVPDAAQVHLTEVERLGDAITGMERESSGFLTELASHTPLWTEYPEWPQMGSGLLLFSEHVDSKEDEPGLLPRASVSVYFLYELQVDGTSGTLVSVDLVPSQLPFLGIPDEWSAGGR